MEASDQREISVWLKRVGIGHYARARWAISWADFQTLPGTRTVGNDGRLLSEAAMPAKWAL